MSSPHAQIWADDRPLDPSWRAPVDVAPAPIRPRRPWRPHPVLIGVVVLALVFALVWALGGFDRRADRLIRIAPGTLISTGPYEFVFTRATSQRVNRFGKEYVNQVFVYGKGRTTGDEAITPSTLNKMFAAEDPKTQEFHEMEGQRFGPGATFGHGTSFTPGLPMVDYTVTFEFSDAYRPGGTIAFAVADLEFTDTSLLRTGEKIWNPADQQYVLQLPIAKLPDEK